MSSETIRAAVVGATGYTGAELLRLLLGHPRAEISAVVGQSKAGMPIREVLPSFAGLLEGPVAAFDADRVAERSDVAFCALPHGASAGIVASLLDRGLTVFDLSADFRLRDREVYETWYGPHEAPERFGQGAYGMVELYRGALEGAELVAVPGCYPTAAILALAPLLREALIASEGIVVDAKSGVSGAGRAPSVKTHLPEAAEGIRAYKIASHRHTPEIEQEIAAITGSETRILFTPHLVPMSRGILATCYAMAHEGSTAERCTEVARELYDGSPSVAVLDAGSSPDTLWVRGSNRVHIAYAHDPRSGRIIALAAIDNLVKGAAGQAIQCMNVVKGLPEGMGLDAPAHWP